MAQTASPTTHKRLDHLRRSYESAITKQAGPAYETAIKALDAKYATALDRLVTTATQGGKLDEAIILRDEKKRVTDALPLPETDDEAPESLRPLRSTYREQLAAIVATRDKAIEPLKKRYLEELQRLEAERTKAGSLDDALVVRAVTESLKPSIESPTAPLAKHKVTVAKGSGRTDSKAAKAMVEWALANRALLETDLGTVGANEKIKTVPASNFSVRKIIAEPALQPFPWQLLDGLSELTTLEVIMVSPCKVDDLAHLKNLGLLKSLRLKGPLSIEILKALPSMPGLGNLNIYSSDDVTTVLPELRTKFPGIAALSYWSGPLTEEAISEIAKWPAIQQLDLIGPLTVDMGNSLAKMVGLQKLLFYGSTYVDPQAVRRLVNLKSFSYQGGKPSPGMIEALVTLPKLTTLTLGASCAKPDEIAALAASKSLSSLRLMNLNENQSVASQHIRAITTLSGLNELNLYFSDITDSDLFLLSKMKGLRRLDITKTQVTDAALKAFKKALPKCQVVH
jgi:Leucine-rich repeat (LRR) protein